MAGTTIFFSKSDGTKEIKADSKWNAGREGPHRRTAKDHTVRTGKAAQRKATHHYGSGNNG